MELLHGLIVQVRNSLTIHTGLKVSLEIIEVKRIVQRIPGENVLGLEQGVIINGMTLSVLIPNIRFILYASTRIGLT